MRATPWLLLASLALAGCGGPETIDPIYEIDEDAWVVVLPFKDPDYRSRWDSPIGRDVMIGVTQLLQANAEFRVRPYQDVIDLYMVEDLESLKPKDIAALCRADYVLECDLLKWDPLAEKHVGITLGKAKIRARLFQVEKNQDPEDDEAARRKVEDQNQARRRAGLADLAYARGGRYVSETEVESRFPDTYMEQYGEVLLTDDEARAGLVQATALVVAKLYYEHEEWFKHAKGR